MKYYIRKRGMQWQFFWFMGQAKRPEEWRRPNHVVYSLENAMKLVDKFEAAAKRPENPDMRNMRAH